jgi:hypothetical protein
MKRLTIVLMLLAAALLAQARLVSSWSFQKLHDQADLVVIAKYISTKDTAEQAVLPNITPDNHVIGLSSEFDIEVVMKGDESLKKLVLHHYRLAPNQVFENGPDLASFDSKHHATRYLLFLRRESDGRYAPVSGQTDPARDSILRLDPQ